MTPAHGCPSEESRGDFSPRRYHERVSAAPRTSPMKAKDWRTPAAILLCGGLILTLSTGTRAGFGLFLKPMTFVLGWGRETFAFALALQNLMWGVFQPFVGMIADRK